LTKCIQCAARTYGAGKAAVAVPAVFASRRLLRHKASGVHSISSFVASLMRKHFLPPDNHSATVDVTIPSFLDPTDAKPVKTTERLAFLQSLPAEPYILFVGALQAHKGLLTLLEAYQRLSAPPPLLLIGTAWPDTPRQFPPNVTALTDVPHDHVMLAWERCLFGVAPSIWPEPLGGVVFEAMSKGKAMIGTTPGGHTDMIVDSETGLLMPGGDVAALASAMQRLIDDPTQREAFGKAGQARAARFTAASAIPQFEAVYAQLIRSNSNEQADLAQMGENG
jgi:glycosyltransferase involved in cell wall biosynthesis